MLGYPTVLLIPSCLEIFSRNFTAPINGSSNCTSNMIFSQFATGGRGGVVVRLLASHLREQALIPFWVNFGFSTGERVKRFGRLLATMSWEPMRVKCGEYVAAPECKGGENWRSPRKPDDQRHLQAEATGKSTNRKGESLWKNYSGSSEQKKTVKHRRIVRGDSSAKTSGSLFVAQHHGSESTNLTPTLSEVTICMQACLVQCLFRIRYSNGNQRVPLVCNYNEMRGRSQVITTAICVALGTAVLVRHMPTCNLVNDHHFELYCCNTVLAVSTLALQLQIYRLHSKFNYTTRLPKDQRIRYVECGLQSITREEGVGFVNISFDLEENIQTSECLGWRLRAAFTKTSRLIPASGVGGRGNRVGGGGGGEFFNGRWARGQAGSQLGRQSSSREKTHSGLGMKGGRGEGAGVRVLGKNNSPTSRKRRLGWWVELVVAGRDVFETLDTLTILCNSFDPLRRSEACWLYWRLGLHELLVGEAAEGREWAANGNVQSNFSREFGEDAPSAPSIRKWYTEFKERGCICKRKSTRLPPVSEATAERVRESLRLQLNTFIDYYSKCEGFKKCSLYREQPAAAVFVKLTVCCLRVALIRVKDGETLLLYCIAENSVDQICRFGRKGWRLRIGELEAILEFEASQPIERISVDPLRKKRPNYITVRVTAATNGISQVMSVLALSYGHAQN
ncbi:hypothetical protein PR048_022967 [Dryococelus australis]|uniref:Uncharacterized protein n=1 Tax=Dryococelus australis TaxID=614101 RepID=A0ABQ9GST5_9NEOP|nr:hypothetical protein PR048_022967 [Dryococelus australis]